MPTKKKSKAKSGRTPSRQPRKLRLPIKTVPEEIKQIASADPVGLPEPAHDTIKLLASGSVKALIVEDPEPGLWERINRWFGNLRP